MLMLLPASASFCRFCQEGRKTSKLLPQIMSLRVPQPLSEPHLGFEPLRGLWRKRFDASRVSLWTCLRRAEPITKALASAESTYREMPGEAAEGGPAERRGLSTTRLLHKGDLCHQPARSSASRRLWWSKLQAECRIFDKFSVRLAFPSHARPFGWSGAAGQDAPAALCRDVATRAGPGAGREV